MPIQFLPLLSEEEFGRYYSDKIRWNPSRDGHLVVTMFDAQRTAKQAASQTYVIKKNMNQDYTGDDQKIKGIRAHPLKHQVDLVERDDKIYNNPFNPTFRNKTNLEHRPCMISNAIRVVR